jgi:Zn-dependent protease with chaperone function
VVKLPYTQATVALRIEFDFARYVAARKGEAASQLREGAAYAYGGDLKVRSTLNKVRPVTLAMEAAVRFWHSVGRARMLGNAVKVSERQFPRLHGIVDRCAQVLQIDPPALYVSPKLLPQEVQTLGTSDEAAIVLGSGLADHLSDDELASVVGGACGHIQNGHTPYLTTLYLLQTAGNLVVRWVAQPAILGLRGWARRAEITCDRASALCTRNVDITVGTLVKQALGAYKLFSEVDVDEYLRQLDELQSGPGRFQELLAVNPYLPKRVRALRLFAETTYFRSVVGVKPTSETPGLTREECDVKVGELLAVLG